MSLYKFILISILFWVFWASDAHAGFIFQRPLYIGLTNGLVGSWSFDAPTLGTSSVSDLSGNSNTGFFVNGPAKAIGRIGQALNFDGGDDLVNAGNMFNAPTAYTFSAWIYPRSTGETSVGRILDKTAGPAGGGGYYFKLNSTSNLVIGHDAQTDAAASNGTVTLSTWQHITATWNGSTVVYYINGSSSGSVSYSTSIPSNTTSLTLGNRFDAARTFDGLIDEVRVYNRALSAEEVRRLYHQGATTKFNSSQKNQLTNGLVGMWSFDAPTLGTSSASDLSGNANTGFFVNGPAKAIGRIGQALSFDGTNDYVNVGDVGTVDTATTLSICAWVNLKTLTDDDAIVAKDGVPADGFILFRDDVGLTSGRTDTYNISLGDSTDADAVRIEGATNASKSNVWTHVCATIKLADATGLRLYIDGVEDANSPVSTVSIGAIDAGTEPLRIGATSEAAIRPFNGLIDEVRVYNRALSPEEVRRLYHQGATTKFNSSQKDRLTNGLVGMWSFDAPTLGTSSASDLSGNANTGFFVNGPAKAIGRIGQALDFDGSDDRVDLGDLSVVEGIPALTVSAWVYPRNASHPGSLSENIVEKEGGGLDTFYLLWTSGEAMDFCVGDGVAANVCGSSASFQNFQNTWKHVVGVYDGTNVMVYVDGVRGGTIGSLSVNTTNTTHSVMIAGNTNPWLGLLDEVRIYNRVLSTDEIRRLYNMGR